jgi:hypothetical protein
MTVPGIGPVTATALLAIAPAPEAFNRGRDFAAWLGLGTYFGLTSKRWQSGSSVDVKGRISKAGDPDVRTTLYEAASDMLTRYKGQSALKSWGEKIAKRSQKKAVVAVARKLAVVMHAMWRDGTLFADRPHAEDTPAGATTRRIASCWAPTHDARSSHQSHAGSQLSGDTTSAPADEDWCRNGHRKHDILPVAGAIRDHA